MVAPNSEFLKKLRTKVFQTSRIVALDKWFPHIPVSILTFTVGVLILRQYFGTSLQGYLPEHILTKIAATPVLFPPLLIGGGLAIMSLGLMFRYRIAWVTAIILILIGLANTYLKSGFDLISIEILSCVLLLLILFWRKFDQTSLASATLFALSSVLMALTFATFGTYYLGSEFSPPITDLVTALYYSIVTMSTVGYGDITPQTFEAKLFVVSIIVLGIVTFATSLTAVIGPLFATSLHRILKPRGKNMKRENHFVVIGTTPLAINVWRALVERGRPVTRIVRQPLSAVESETVDVVVGEPSNIEVLKQAGADRAEAVLAMLDDDGENAFVILALKELGGTAKSVAAINDLAHERRIKLVGPDMTIAPQVIGGELLAMALSGETISSEFVMKRVLHERDRRDHHSSESDR